MPRRKKVVDGTGDSNTELNAGDSNSESILIDKEKEKKIKKDLHRKKILANQEKRLPKHKERLKKKEIESEKEAEENPESSVKRRKRESNFYVTNKALLAELIKWRDSAPEVEDRVISEELGKMILLIATRLTNHANFIRYPNDVKTEMISYACFKCVQGLKNYNFEFSNPFAYITMACYNAFLSTCGKYYKQLNIKRMTFEKMLRQVEELNPATAKKLYDNYIKNYVGENVDLENKKINESKDSSEDSSDLSTEDFGYNTNQE